MASQDSDPQHSQEIIYFVDNVKYETDQTYLTGAQIKARIPNFDPSYALFLEGPGKEADELIKDDTSVDLKRGHGPCRFYTVPPASFG